MTVAAKIAPRKSATPAPSKGKADGKFDIIAVGGGAAGLATALFARWQGSSVLLLEKANELGGTTKKAAFWYWVPNNEAMKAAGMKDPREDCIRYMARLSRPEVYNPKAPRLGVSEWEYAQFEAIYDYASKATELLAKKGALEYRHVAPVPDYWAEIPEDKAPTGRVLFPKNGCATMSDGGEVAIKEMAACATKDGVEIKTGHRVQRLIKDPSGRVVGVESSTGNGKTHRYMAKKAVVFCTGGFTHDVELRKNFLTQPVYGGCAAPTNEGDFVRIAGTVGAQLRNMNYAWMCPIIFEKAINHDPGLIGTFSPSGDSMIYVDKNGNRVTNEKLAYNESAQAFFKWDPVKAEYPNLVMMAVWDQQAQDNCAGHEYGRFIVPPGTDDSHVIKGDSLASLSKAIADRLAKYEAHTGGLKLSADFEANLRAAIARFNEFAKTGKDLDFKRGERMVEQLFNGPVAERKTANATMYPLSDKGPYYAALMTGGTLDTKGGPKTKVNGQILDSEDKPIPGLYGVGNCVASASARAYWAGGGTLGPILAFAYLTANAAHKEKAKK